jgi:hypothetical protein
VTWKEYKEAVEAKGLKDSDPIQIAANIFGDVCMYRATEEGWRLFIVDLEKFTRKVK